MKRVLCAALILAVLAAFAGCVGDSGTAATEPSSAEDTTASAADDYVTETEAQTTEVVTEYVVPTTGAVDEEGYYAIEYNNGYIGETSDWKDIKWFDEAEREKIKVTAKIPSDWDIHGSTASYPDEPYELKFDFGPIIYMESESVFLDNYVATSEGEPVPVLDKGSYRAGEQTILYAESRLGSGTLYRMYLIYDGTKAAGLYFYMFRDITAEDEQIIKNIVESVRF